MAPKLNFKTKEELEEEKFQRLFGEGSETAEEKKKRLAAEKKKREEEAKKRAEELREKNAKKSLAEKFLGTFKKRKKSGSELPSIR